MGLLLGTLAVCMVGMAIVTKISPYRDLSLKVEKVEKVKDSH